ncbi:MAG: DNA methyltransferase [Mariniphaga sp.]
MALSFIKSSGNIITEDFCMSLASESKADYVKDKSFGAEMKKVDEVIASTFEKLRERWEENRTQIISNKLDNTALRKKWIIPFLEALGYHPIFIPSNTKSESGTEYQIPYKGWDSEYAPLLQIVHSAQDFDIKDKNSRTHSNKSPQDSLQQFLNTSHHQWAILINGKKVRLLRDFYHSITKGFLEFDLESIFETASSEQFRVLFRILHASRIENQYQGKQEIEYDDEGIPIETEDNCLLEKFHKKSRETGVKVGNKLREQVVEAIEKLGNGFAESLDPDEFQSGKVKAFYAEILNIIYRLLFLMFAEQKGWLPVRNSIYARTYSLNALREMAERGNYSHDDEHDLWEGLKITFKLVTNGYEFKNGDKINAFGGQLFSDKKITTIKSLPLKNKFLLDAIFRLSYFKLDNLSNRINYANLAIDELGSVYESLLDYEPKLAKGPVTLNKREVKRGEFYLDDRGTDRKTTGSYYTDSRLVAQLIESALVPVINNALAGKTTIEEKERALLALKVADIACGSGAFLCAALEKMGEQLSLIRKGDEERPTEDQLREAKRDVLLHCIYGVDLNPMALELAKFSLWITASLPDMPMTFLDHKLKCGNSLIGATPELIEKGIPEEAYKAIGNDNQLVCSELKRKVRRQIEQLSKVNEPTAQYGIQFKRNEINELLRLREALNNRKQEEVTDVDLAEEEYHYLEKLERHYKEWLMADVWTSAFFIEKTEIDLELYPTNITLENLRENQPVKPELIENVLKVAENYNFFHFHLEFAEVFEKGGFDCLLGNPPWEKINFEDEEFFISRSPEIALARNKSERKILMAELPTTNPVLYQEYLSAKRWNDCLSVYFRESGAFPYTGVSRVNLYSIFAEQYEGLINHNGATGNVLPTGIIVDNNNKDLYFYLIKNNKLDTVIDFENSKALFPDVHRSYRFCLFVSFGKNGRNQYKFFQTEPNQQEDYVQITLDDIEAINPNSKTCPSFRNKIDFLLAKKVYKKWGVLQNESYPEKNMWQVKIRTPFNLSNDSWMFKPFQEDLLPLYEAKYIHHYNHRHSEFIELKNQRVGINNLIDTSYKITSQYYLAKEELISRYGSNNWFLSYRRIARATDERTMISSIIPGYPMGNTLFIVETLDIFHALFLLSTFNSFSFDFFARQTVGGTDINSWILKQLPVINYELIKPTILEKVQEKAFYLSYNANDLEPVANEYGFIGEPFIWNEKERFQLQCELDAIYAHLYGLEKEEMDYILETFPIVKRKDIAKYGSYRTKETILQLYDEFAWVREEMKQKLFNNPEKS